MEKKREDVTEQEITRNVLMRFLEFTDDLDDDNDREEMLDVSIKTGIWKSSFSSS